MWAAEHGHVAVNVACGYAFSLSCARGVRVRSFVPRTYLTIIALFVQSAPQEALLYSKKAAPKTNRAGVHSHDTYPGVFIYPRNADLSNVSAAIVMSMSFISASNIIMAGTSG